MTDDTWTTRDLPVLRAVVEIWDKTGDVVDASTVTRTVGFDSDTVQRALRTLNTESFFRDVTEVAGGEIWMIGAPTGQALRVAGAWPSPENLLERLIDALEGAADDEDREHAERGKSKQAAILLGSVGTRISIAALGGATGNVISQ